jgi:hypothetical protein
MTSSSPFQPSDPGRPSGSLPGLPGQSLPAAEPAFDQPLIQPVRATPPKRSNAGGYLLTIAAVIAVGGLAFAVGRVTAPAPAATARSAFAFGQGGAGGGGDTGPNGSFAPGQGGANGGFARRALTTEATVTAVAADHLTIQIGASGQTVDVSIDGGTTFHTQQVASATAVTPGSKVLLQFNAATAGGSPGGTTTLPGSGGSAAPSGVPGGGFLRGFGTVKDVTVLAP